ncbi:MAG: protein translocase subunit SecD [Bacteroidota bacterium]|nr:protein translocase subunit SecD [Bacteroidota bacterium]
MKDLRFRLILTVLLIGLSFYLLHFTYADYRNSQKLETTRENLISNLKRANPNLPNDKIQAMAEAKIDSIIASDPSIAKDKAKRIKLGLDLQGGMYIAMEVNTAKLIEKLAKDPDPTFNQALKEAETEATRGDKDVVSVLASKLQAKGIRLSRYFGTIRESDSDIISKLKKQADDAVTRAMEIIRTRVDKYGVSEPSIQKQGTRRIVVELPGVAKEEEAKQLLQGSALLEFKLLIDPQKTVEVMQKIDQVLAGTVKMDSASAKDSTKIAQTAQKEKQDNGKLSAAEFAKQHPFFSVAVLNPQSGTAEAYVKESDKVKLNLMLNRPEVQRAMPNNIEFLYSAKPIIGEGGAKYFMLYCVNKDPELTGGYITDAKSSIDQSTAQAEVSMTMNSEGAREWARITGANIKKRIAIVLDGQVYSAPTVQNKIPNGSSQITGMKDLEEAKLMEIVLKAGALPAPVDIMEQRTVGPSLGQDSVNAGQNSLLLGFALVAIFMMVYYKMAGGVADIALFITILFLFAVLAGFGATLTLPGIAGIVLTMGMAVDANVLIYERMREEMETGKTLRAAITAGFQHALPAIVDSNLTTFITGVILYQFGTGPVQGFALTLMIGLVTSMFGALVVTRVIFEYMAYKNQHISLG